MDISTEITAIQAASEGSELRQPLVDALNKLNSGALPAVTVSDAGKILKVGANGWEVGEKSGYMPVPTATKQITENDTYDVLNYSQVQVYVSSGGGSTLITKHILANGTYEAIDDSADGYSEVIVNVPSNVLTPEYQGLAYCYAGTNGIFYHYTTNINYVNFFELEANIEYYFFIGHNVSNRLRALFFSGKTFNDFSQYINTPSGSQTEIYNNGINITGGTELAGTELQKRLYYTPSESGILIVGTSSQSALAPAYCVRM